MNSFLFDASRTTYFTREEANAAIGQLAETNAGCAIIIKGKFCEGPNQYTLTGDDGYHYAKTCNNGLYCWVLN